MNKSKNRITRLFALFTLLSLSFFLSVIVAEAAPALHILKEEKQPTGETFKASLQGDEWFNYTAAESGDLVVKGTDGYWYYGEAAVNGLKKSNAKYKIDKKPFKAQSVSDVQALREKRLNELKISKTEIGLMQSSLQPAQVSEAAMLPTGTSVESVSQVSAPQKMLVILVSFTDVTIANSESVWNNSCFGSTGKTVKTYFNEVSDGTFYFTPANETYGTANNGVVKVTLNYAHPNPGSNTGDLNRQIVADALEAANPYVNYSSYDINGNGYIDYNELHIVTVVAGYEAAIGYSSPSVWAHRWSLYGDIVSQLDGKYISCYPYGGYTQVGEIQVNHMATIGTICHELGHDIGLPDLYDTDTPSQSAGVGIHSLMGSGNWCKVSGEYYGATPSHLDAWCKTGLGFAEPIIASNGNYNVSSAAEGYTVLKVPTSNQKQYFLVENRQFSGFDAGLQIFNPQSGIAIWHIDETVVDLKSFSNEINADPTHKGVDLEEANEVSYGKSQLDDNNAKGIEFDNYYYLGNNTAFNLNSIPNSKLYDGTDSKKTINISGTSSGTMVVQVSSNDTQVTISATDATASEQGTDTGKFKITRTGSTAAALTVKYTISGTATNGTDYNTLSGSVIIPVGATTATITVTPKNDTTAENNETVSITLAANSAYSIGAAKSATVTIYDNDKTQVTIKATDASAYEAGLDTAKYTVTRAYGSTAAALTVNYTMSGTATKGTDYNTLSGTVSIPAGSTTTTITVTPKNDTTAENNETVIATIAAGTGYNVGPAKSATVTLYDNDKTQVSIKATDALAYEAGSETAKYTVTRAYGSTASALTVNYTISGTATNGTDYNTLSGTVTIPAGATTATITLTPKNDTTVESNETVIITLASGTGYNVDPAKSATATIYDNDKTMVTIKATDPTASETGPDTGKFTVTRAYGSTASSLTVKYTISGTATNGTDYNTLSGTVTIAAGATTAAITVTPKNNTVPENSETVIVTLAANSAYNIGATKSATVTIADND